MDKRLLFAMQLCDTGFPSGAFSHSFGLETYVREGNVRDKATLKAWMIAYLSRQWIYNDGLAVRLTYEAVEAGDEEALWDVDRRLAAQTVPSEARNGAIRMGRRTLGLVREFADTPLLGQYEENIRAKRCFGHPAVVFAISARTAGITLSEALLCYAYSCAATLVQNAVRAIPLGQTDGQKLMYELREHVAAAATRVVGEIQPDEFGISPPGLELAAIRHEKLDVRLFMS
jgi:urease accessory protein